MGRLKTHASAIFSVILLILIRLWPFSTVHTIVSRGDWIYKLANIKVENNGSVLYVGSRLQNSPYIFAYSSTREKSNKRSRTRLITESETGERRHGRVRLARLARVILLRHTLQISLLILRKKNRPFRSLCWKLPDRAQSFVFCD